MKKAGETTRKMAQQRRKTTNLILLIVSMIGVVLFILINNWQTLGISAGTVLVLLLLMRMLPEIIDKPIDRRIKMERRADRGAEAEELVEELLGDLDDNFEILHDISSPYGNIDHIVIAASGSIFLIETKAHGGQVEINNNQLLVNGKYPEKNFIAQTLKNSYWLRGEIEKVIGQKSWITPMLVFTNAFVQMGQMIKGVHILDKKFLLPTLQRVSRGNQNMSKIWEKHDENLEQLSGSS